VHTGQLRTHGPDGTFTEDGSLSIARQTLRSVSMRMLGACARPRRLPSDRTVSASRSLKQNLMGLADY
jgi:hypothetical protein